ncbi:hypothetical protein ACA910_004855 [Epithemia clementina (nom. ined.)]
MAEYNGSCRNDTPSAVLELEQKFVVSPSSSTTDRLFTLGFRQAKEYHMVDWYFDFPKSNYPLMRQDMWLRYRRGCLPDADEISFNANDGQWELKRGQQKQSGDESQYAQRTTVYEEIVGEDAVDLVRSVLLDIEAGKPISKTLLLKDAGGEEHFAEQTARLADAFKPGIPSTLPGLKPFARIVTHRSSWKVPKSHPDSNGNKEEQRSKYDCLTVDLDQTDFGYNVGEVEMLVPITTSDNDGDQDSRVQKAKLLIQELIDHLTNSDESTSEPRAEKELEGQALVAKGKLEYFLYTQRPSIFALMRELGLAT